MTPSEFERALKRDLAKLKQEARAGIQRTAYRAVGVVQKRTPVAFAELKDSIHADDMKTVVGAPHAQAVEKGSRPHLVPLEELIKWVKLRGMQGLSSKKHEGSTTREHATRVASQLQSMERGGSLSIDAPRQIAKAIQASILKHGTKPHWFVLNSLSDVMSVLDDEMKKVFK